MICSVLLTKCYSGDQIKKTEWAGHVIRMRERRDAYRFFWWGNMRERNYSEDPGVNGRILLKWILRHKTNKCIYKYLNLY